MLGRFVFFFFISFVVLFSNVLCYAEDGFEVIDEGQEDKVEDKESNVEDEEDEDKNKEDDVEDEKEFYNPVLIKKVPMKNFGGYVVRYGHFNRDGEVDVLAAQSRNSEITCLTAFTLNGDILWQIGKPKRNSYDISADRPVQVYDWNGDGIDDVIAVMNGRLRVINGRNGKNLKSRPVAREANDAVYIGKFWDGEKKILIKNRYKQFWVFNKKLNKIFEKKTPYWTLSNGC